MRREPAPPKEETLWAVFNAEGDRVSRYLHKRRDQALDRICGALNVSSWDRLYSEGFRCRRVTVTPEE